MQTLLRFLLSRRAAVAAVALLAAILAAGSMAPEGEDLEKLRARRPRAAAALEKVRPAELSQSPLVLVLIGYVGLGVAASVATRIRGRLAARRREGPVPLERFRARRSLLLPVAPGEAEGRVREALRAERLPVDADLTGSRGSAGFWGSMAFHCGLLVTLAGIGLSAAGRFTGEIVLTEGSPLPAAPASFLRASPPEAVLRLSGAQLAVSDVDAAYARGTQLTDVSAVLAVERPGRPPERHFTSVNVPGEIEGLQFTVHAYGYAPEIVAFDPSGRRRADGQAVLRVLPPGAEDSLELDGGATIRFRFYPDHVLAGGADANRTMLPVNPVLVFRWYEGPQLVAQGAVRPGETAAAGGYRIAFTGLGRWVDFLVARDPGLPWFAVGTLLGIFGLALRFFRHEQAWGAVVTPAATGSAVDLELSAKYFPALLETKADAVAARLAKG